MYSSAERQNVRTYRCSSRDTASGACGGARLPADAVEVWAWQQITDTIQHPDRIGDELKRRQDDGPDAMLTGNLQTARRELARRERKQADLLQRFTSSEDTTFPWELVEREIGRLEREKAQWHATISSIEARLAQQELALHQLEALHAYCQRVGVNLERFDFAEQRLALEALNVRVSGNGRSWTLAGGIPITDQGVTPTTSQIMGITPESKYHSCVMSHLSG